MNEKKNVRIYRSVNNLMILQECQAVPILNQDQFLDERFVWGEFLLGTSNVTIKIMDQTARISAGNEFLYF